MSDDIIKRLREAIAAGPVRGEWQAHGAFNEWAVSSDWSVGGPSKSGRQHVASCFRVSKKDAPEYAAMFKANAIYIAAASPDNIAALLDRLDKAERENERLREALLPFVDEGIELNCDECGGDQNKCNASCVVRKGRAAIDAAMAAEQPSDERREG